MKGKMISIRINEDILKLLKESAKKQHLSLSNFLVFGGLRLAGYQASLCPRCGEISWEVVETKDNEDVIKCPNGHKYKVKIF